MAQQRNFGLDVLRANAILFVIIGHGIFITGPEYYPKIFNYILYDGVGVFFVLSGFLIGRILIYDFQKYGTTLSTLVHFWLRRWFRTLPLYFVILLLVSVPSMMDNRIEIRQVIPYFFFVNNFAVPPETRFFGESWSLAVEEWFYLLIPLMAMRKNYSYERVNKFFNK